MLSGGNQAEWNIVPRENGLIGLKQTIYSWILLVCVLPSLLLVPTQSFSRFLTIYLGISRQLLFIWRNTFVLPNHLFLVTAAWLARRLQVSAQLSPESWSPPPLYLKELRSILFCPHGCSLSLCCISPEWSGSLSTLCLLVCYLSSTLQRKTVRSENVYMGLIVIFSVPKAGLEQFGCSLNICWLNVVFLLDTYIFLSGCFQ